MYHALIRYNDHTNDIQSFNLLSSAFNVITKINFSDFIDSKSYEEFPRKVINCIGILDNAHVLATVQILDQFQNLGLPPGIYLRIFSNHITYEEVERKGKFPLSAFSSYGPSENFMLLNRLDEVVKKNAHRYKVHNKSELGRRRRQK